MDSLNIGGGWLDKKLISFFSFFIFIFTVVAAVLVQSRYEKILFQHEYINMYVCTLIYNGCSLLFYIEYSNMS